MRKEEIRGWLLLTVLGIFAAIAMVTLINPVLERFPPENMKPFTYFIVVIIISFLINVIGLEILHVLGSVAGGYKIVSFNVLGLCFYKEGEKWKFGFRDFNGLAGETKIAPKKGKLNANLQTWFPIFGYAVELATCIVVFNFIKSSNVKASWLASAAIINLVVASMLFVYNFVPIKLDSMTDGYKIRLFSNKTNLDAYNKTLDVLEKRRVGENIEKIPVFPEITEFTAEINSLAMYQYLEEEDYAKAMEIIDVLLEHKKVINVNDYNRLIAQKLYLTILTKPVKEAKKLYDEICPTEIRRFIANDVSMPSIRAYIMIAGTIEESESEVAYARSKVEKAKKRALKSEIKAEEILLEKAINFVYEKHPKWKKESAAE